MPASGKMLKSRQQAANRAAGIGDADGRLPNRIKPTETNVKCSQCGMEIRATKTNTEARQHAESRHPAFTFAVCFVGAFDPTAAPPAAGGGAASSSAVEGDGGLAEDMAELKVEPAAAPEKPKKKKDDLSFLDAALDPKAASKKK
jgi:hypothetical protein